MKSEGTIVFWNKIYGFVQLDEGSVYFNRNCLNSLDTKRIALLDVVSVEYDRNRREGKHFGKLTANKVDFIKKGNFDNYPRSVGHLEKWNDTYGFIRSEQFDKEIFTFHTRFIHVTKRLKKGDAVIFHAVKSSTNEQQLFSLFIYPLEFEQDIDWLMSQYEITYDKSIKRHLLGLLNKQSLPKEKRLLLKLKLSENYEYSQVKSIIKELEEIAPNSVPNYDTLHKIFNDVFLIKLWEDGIIETYHLHDLSRYFVNGTAANKRIIITRIEKEHQTVLLNAYLQRLKNEGRFSYLNNHIKSLLDIAFRNEGTRNEKVYSDVEKIVLENLQGQEVIDLWLSGYLKLSDEYILEHFDIDNSQQVKRLLNRQSTENDIYKSSLKKLYEQYFFNFKNSKFEEEYPKLVARLLIYKECFAKDFSQILEILELKFSVHQNFLLWIFNAPINFDAKKYVIEYVDRLSRLNARN